jgi:hypothetical protein
VSGVDRAAALPPAALQLMSQPASTVTQSSGDPLSSPFVVSLVDSTGRVFVSDSRSIVVASLAAKQPGSEASQALLALTGRSVVTFDRGIASFGGRSGIALALFGAAGGPYTILFNATVTTVAGTTSLFVNGTVWLRECLPGEEFLDARCNACAKVFLCLSSCRFIPLADCPSILQGTYNGVANGDCLVRNGWSGSACTFTSCWLM